MKLRLGLLVALAAVLSAAASAPPASAQPPPGLPTCDAGARFAGLPDGSRCQRQISKRASPFRQGRRFRGWVEGASGRGPDRFYIIGNGIRYVFLDRFASRTRYRLCWRHLRTGRRWCLRRRSGPARRPDRTRIMAAPEIVGAWVASWRVGGRIVARFRFHVGIGD